MGSGKPSPPSPLRGGVGVAKSERCAGWIGQYAPYHVITGLVPVIPMLKSAEPHRIEMAGTRPAMTWRA